MVVGPHHQLHCLDFLSCNLSVGSDVFVERGSSFYPLLDFGDTVGDYNLLSLLVLLLFVKEGLDVGLNWVALENG